MERYLCSCGVLIKEFKHFAESVTAKVKAAAYLAATAAKRPVEYLRSPKLSKEDYARQIALEKGIKEGLIVLFSANEPCYSYSVRGDRASKEIHLVIGPRMCTHFYHYFMHADFGLMHVRLELVSFYGRSLSQRSGVVSPANGSSRAEVPAGR